MKEGDRVYTDGKSGTVVFVLEPGITVKNKEAVAILLDNGKHAVEYASDLEPNTKLQAIAEDMLEALRLADGILNDNNTAQAYFKAGYSSLLHEVQRAVKKAIAKADGEDG